MTADPNEHVESYCRNWNGVTPYARVTIVRTQGATAAKAGAKAVVTAEGELIGWIGGGCLRGSVLRAAREAIDAAAPRLIRVRPREDISAPQDADGVALYASGCPGKGGADVFIEPVMPKPPLIVVGHSQVGQALAELAPGLGFDLVLIGGEGRASQFPELSGKPGLERGFIVIATQGSGDHAALKAALSSAAPYVACIASRAKAEALREKLAAEGVSGDALARLRAPAGLDIGARTPSEIAVSIMAEIIAMRSARPGTADPGASRSD